MADKGRRKAGNDGGVASNNHIRFDQDDDDTGKVVPSDAAPDNQASFSRGDSGVSACSNNNASRKRNDKRKRKRPSTHDTGGGDDANSCSKMFNGLIVAISTLESKNNNGISTKNDTNNNDGTTTNDSEGDPYQNYKTLKQLLQTLGATISPQVHKRVHYLISTDSAVQNLTQRVRQALKRNVDIIDVAWVKKCREQKKRVGVEDHLCNDLAKYLMVEKEKEKKREKLLANSKDGGKNNDGLDEEDIPDEDNSGWSTPVHLDCCCVCHENGDDNCPWCMDCNLTLARKKRKAASKK